MTAKDIHWGRGGGRDLPASVVLPGTLFVATCDGGHRYTAVEASIGTACSGCGCPIRRPDHIDAELAAGGRPDPEVGFVRVVAAQAAPETQKGAAA